MPKQPTPATGAAARAKRKASNVIPFPKKRGRPKGPVTPFTTLARRMANPDRAAALLARLIAHHYGEKLDDAAAMAVVLMTPPAEWSTHEWPDRIAWFNDWRLATGGPLRHPPSLARVRELLRRGHVPSLAKRVLR